jgi:hypothetical protein
MNLNGFFFFNGKPSAIKICKKKIERFIHCKKTPKINKTP